ncbi:secreted NIS1 [Fusarium albosuccineum]|uniref:Secreted NIS1 n=1 Tax=Fusarium albosuccineum TaxID=1237068 RepID=A0A8H4PJ17_9HYPO|nr:secreted NIS1 [Fusarium albosuccineum]
MRFSVAAVATTLLALTEARIVGIKVPKTIKPGDEFEAVIISENYIQSVYDVAIAFGYVNGKGYPGTLGPVADSFYIGPDESNQLHSFNKTLTIPKEAQKGQGLVTASLFSIYGASGSPTLSNYNVTVTFGDKTSTEYKSSQA